MKINHIEHIGIAVRNLEQAIAFTKSSLDFPVTT